MLGPSFVVGGIIGYGLGKLAGKVAPYITAFFAKAYTSASKLSGSLTAKFSSSIAAKGATRAVASGADDLTTSLLENEGTNVAGHESQQLVSKTPSTASRNSSIVLDEHVGQLQSKLPKKVTKKGVSFADDVKDPDATPIMGKKKIKKELLDWGQLKQNQKTTGKSIDLDEIDYKFVNDSNPELGKSIYARNQLMNYENATFNRTVGDSGIREASNQAEKKALRSEFTERVLKFQNEYENRIDPIRYKEKFADRSICSTKIAKP